jgi:hypothetical protein
MLEEENDKEQIGNNYIDSNGNAQNLIPETKEEVIKTKENEPQVQQNSFFDEGKTKRTEDEHSFHLGNYIEDFYENPNFSEKEKKISTQIDELFQKMTKKPISFFQKYLFLVNKILLFTTLTQFLFQRFDIVTLFISVVVLLIEADIFSHKHLYKWLFVLITSLLLDAFVLIDVSPVINNFIIRFFVGGSCVHGVRGRINC